MPKIRWSPKAAGDLERIVRHIQRDNSRAAQEVGSALYNSIEGLRTFALRGRAGRLVGTRELVVAPLPYVVVYRVKDDVVEVVRIYHGAQNRP